MHLLEENRLEALRNIDKAKCTAAHYFNHRVRSRQFHVGELVLSKHKLLHQDQVNKPTLKWEGPYCSAGNPYPGDYILQDMEGHTLPHIFNAKALKNFYY